jgi:hypothetical protein
VILAFLRDAASAVFLPGYKHYSALAKRSRNFSTRPVTAYEQLVPGSYSLFPSSRILLHVGSLIP